MSIASRPTQARSPSPPIPPFVSPYIPASGLPERARPRIDPRNDPRTTPMLVTLVELDPREVVDGIMTPNGFLAADIIPVGKMRESCPHCEGVALQLVLRHRHVKQSHLYCSECTRCYDAVTEHGHSILTI